MHYLKGIFCVLLLSLLVQANSYANDNAQANQEDVKNIFSSFSGGVNAGAEKSDTGAICPQQTSKPMSVTGTLTSAFLEDNSAYIILEADNKKEQIQIKADDLTKKMNPNGEAVKITDIIGDTVKITYVNKQYFDEHDKECVTAKEVTEFKVIKSSLDEKKEKVLGSGSLKGVILGTEEVDDVLFFLVVQESAEKYYLNINYDEMDSYTALKGKNAAIKFSVKQFYDEVNEQWIKEEKIQEVLDDNNINIKPVVETYLYEGAGILQLVTTNAEQYTVHIETYNNQGNTCEYEGICQNQNGKFICTNVDDNDSLEIIRINDKTIKVNKEDQASYCGMNIRFGGTYTKE